MFNFLRFKQNDTKCVGHDERLTTPWCHERAKIGPRTKSKELDYEACNFDHRDFCHCLGKGIQKVMSLRGELRLCSNSAVHAVTSRKT